MKSLSGGQLLRVCLEALVMHLHSVITRSDNACFRVKSRAKSSFVTILLNAIEKRIKLNLITL